MEYRYMPPVAHLLREAQAATGGVKMLTIREHRFPFLQKVGDWNRFNRNSGGTLVEKCCHFFDLMRLVAGCNPVRVMASGGQAVNHLDEVYDGQQSDIWDHAYVIVDFESGMRAMLELCMFAEGSRYQEEISAVGPKGKIECLVPGPGRFWPAHLGAAPVPKVILSPRNPAGPVELEIPSTRLAGGRRPQRIDLLSASGLSAGSNRAAAAGGLAGGRLVGGRNGTGGAAKRHDGPDGQP
jgi:predicted dehydrogenase